MRNSIQISSSSIPIFLCVLLCLNSMQSATVQSIEISDFDPLVDLSVTVEIQKIRSFDKTDSQHLVREYIDEESDPDFYVKVFINDNESVSPVWENTRYVYTPNWSATFNVPDDEEYVDIIIQLWDLADTAGEVDKLCDISGEEGTDDDCYDVELVYSLETGCWTGDDYQSHNPSAFDPSGYGRLNGCDDGSIYKHDRDCELWFDIFQNDFDMDHIPYQKEIQLGLDPLINDTGMDYDNDSIDTQWECKWGYHPLVANDFHAIDLDDDGLDNVEEYMMAAWGADPFRKDLFLELDIMEQCEFPQGAKELLYTAYNRQNIVYHLDDGTMDDSGSDIIPYDESTDGNERRQIYEDYFVHGDDQNPRLGIFHYGVAVFQDEEVNGCAFGSNRFQISCKGMEEKASKAILDRDICYASAYMHETGHTLNFWPIPGHNPFSKYPWQIGWWLSRPYISCMNYGYMYKMVDYSDGSRLLRDYDDWERMDLNYFQDSSWG